MNVFSFFLFIFLLYQCAIMSCQGLAVGLCLCYVSVYIGETVFISFLVIHYIGIHMRAVYKQLLYVSIKIIIHLKFLCPTIE